MGVLEKEAYKTRRKGYLQDAVLATVGTAGLLALAVMAPNTLQLLGHFGGRRFNEQARTAAGRLARKGYVRFEEVNGKKFLRITAEGRSALERAQKKAIAIQYKQRWDQRWRMVIFDVPEKRRSTRDRLRATVQSLGFLRVQDSVWVYPYDCEDLLVLLKAELRIGKDVLYAIVEKIENDGWVRDHFNLKR